MIQPQIARKLFLVVAASRCSMLNCIAMFLSQKYGQTVMHFGSLGFVSMLKETEPRGKRSEFTNSLTDLDKSKQTIGVKTP